MLSGMELMRATHHAYMCVAYGVRCGFGALPQFVYAWFFRPGRKCSEQSDLAYVVSTNTSKQYYSPVMIQYSGISRRHAVQIC